MLLRFRRDQLTVWPSFLTLLLGDDKERSDIAVNSSPPKEGEDACFVDTASPIGHGAKTKSNNHSAYVNVSEKTTPEDSVKKPTQPTLPLGSSLPPIFSGSISKKATARPQQKTSFKSSDTPKNHQGFVGVTSRASTRIIPRMGTNIVRA